MWKNWVLDVTSTFGGEYCFVPIEDDGTLVVGLNVISDECPGKLVGAVHAGGQEEVENWCAEHPEWSKGIKQKG
jgi:hypothetical protein